jgi:hypothetical protein
VQLPEPPLSKVAISAVPGAVVLLDPPELVDQRVLSLKLPVVLPIQYLVAASAKDGAHVSTKATTSPKMNLMAVLTRRPA